MSDFDPETGHILPTRLACKRGRKVIVDRDTTDEFLDKEEPRYGQDRKTLEEKVAELGLETSPIELPPREAD